jgi:hypothetical protein
MSGLEKEAALSREPPCSLSVHPTTSAVPISKASIAVGWQSTFMGKQAWRFRARPKPSDARRAQYL